MLFVNERDEKRILFLALRAIKSIIPPRVKSLLLRFFAFFSKSSSNEVIWFSFTQALSEVKHKRTSEPMNEWTIQSIVIASFPSHNSKTSRQRKKASQPASQPASQFLSKTGQHSLVMTSKEVSEIVLWCVLQIQHLRSHFGFGGNLQRKQRMNHRMNDETSEELHKQSHHLQ